MKFLDQVEIKVRSGDGGEGLVTFRQEKYVPRGGPAGGDGGHGGSVFLEADPNLYTLMDFRYSEHHIAEDGEPGGSAKQRGADGDDVVLRVPPGTVARDADTNETIGEVIEEGERIIVAEGGRGGRGNAFFKSSTNQAPRHAQPGEPGEERRLILELKLLADVGLVGFPNAGKSTLLAAVSAAEPEAADYPFTTTQPSLGMVYLNEFKSFAMADLPGIIEDAHEGKGLGTRFLRHIERNAVLLFTIPITSKNLAGDYKALLHELREHDPALLDKPRVVALTKIDVLPEEEQSLLPEIVADDFPDDVEIVPISAVAHVGVDELIQTLWGYVQSAERPKEAVT